MKCPKCQNDNPDHAKFCVECGDKLELKCSNCGFNNSPSYKFCAECGNDLGKIKEHPSTKPLSFDEKIENIQKYLPKGIIDKVLSQRSKIEGEKKEVTVMFCDMAGFTPLVEKIGAERAYAIMDQVYEILIHKVSDFEGTVNEMTGDGVMALFGAPIALENAPQRAIQSALAIQREITKFSDSKKSEGPWSPIRMRIGIHTGPVVVGTLGNDLRVEFKAVGETVNIASRMQTLAEPGSTYVTEDTFKLTEGFFRFESLGEKPVKGIQQPVSVYQVLAPSTRSTRFEVNAERGLSAFVGRQRELELLMDGYERIKEGRGQAFSIVAEAGVGKTRLVYEFRKALANEDMAIREGRCLSYSQNEAYHPIVDVLKSYFNILDDDNDLEIKEKVRRVLKGINGDQLSLTPYLLELLNVKDSSIDPALSPEERKRRFISALKQITLKGSEIRPTVFIIEDLHWMDKTSEETLKDIFESIAGSRVLLIFTFRPEYIHTWGAKTYHSQINLNRLSNRESLMLISDLLDSLEVDPVLQELILEKTEGVPFFIEELIKSLKKLQVIEKKDDRYQLARDVQKVSIPSTIQDVIMARVDALPERAKEVIQAASAIEREFGYELIKEIVGMTQDELLSNLSILKDLELIYERGIFPKSSYVFKHALTQEVVYGSMLKDRARNYHEKIAQAMERMYADRLDEFYATLAYQYSQSENHQKAYEYLKMSGIRASENYANQEAYTFYFHAIEVLKRLPETEKNKKKIIETTILIYNPMFLLGFPEGSLEILQNGERLSKELGDKNSLAIFYGFISRYFGYMGNPLEGIRYTEPRFFEAQQNQDIELMAPISIGLFLSYDASGYFYKVLEVAPDVITLLEKTKKESWDFGAPYNGYSWLCCCYADSLCQTGNFEKSQFFFRKGQDFAKQINHTVSMGYSAVQYAVYYFNKGDGKGAAPCYTNSIKYFEEANWPWMIGLAWIGLGRAHMLLGDLPAAQMCIEKGSIILQNSHALRYRSFGPFSLSLLQYESGDYVKAEMNAKEALALSIKNHERHVEGIARVFLGRILGKINDLKKEDAEESILKGIRILDELRLKPHLLTGYFVLGELYANAGRREEARENLNKALSMCQEMGIEYWPDKIQEVLDRL